LDAQTEKKTANHGITSRMNKPKTLLLGILLSIAGLVGVVVILGSIPFSSSKTLPNGATVRITHPPVWLSLWAMLFNTDWWPRSTVSYQPKSGPPGNIVFWEDAADRPYEVFLSSDGHSLLCLYDYDTSAPLFKVDPDRPFDPSLVTYNIKRLVSSSPWRVEEAALADWEEVQQDLRPPHAASGWIGDSVDRSIQNIKEGQPPVPYAGQPPTP
jgi:hypothetical protein